MQVLTVTKENYMDVINQLKAMCNGRQMMEVIKTGDKLYQFSPYFPEIGVHHAKDAAWIEEKPIIFVADKYSTNCFPLYVGSKIVANDKAVTLISKKMLEKKNYKTIIYNRFSAVEKLSYINSKLYERITDAYCWWDFGSSWREELLHDAGRRCCEQLSTMLETYRKNTDFSIYLNVCYSKIETEILVHIDIDGFTKGEPLDSVVSFTWNHETSSDMMTILHQVVNDYIEKHGEEKKEEFVDWL